MPRPPTPLRQRWQPPLRARCVRGSLSSGDPLPPGSPPLQPLHTAPSPGPGLGGNICRAPWQQNWGHDLQMCWEESSASSWGSLAFRICGGGAGPLPASDTGWEECIRLNGPCVKLLGGGQSPRTPPKSGPEPALGQSKRQPMSCACSHNESSAHPQGPAQSSLSAPSPTSRVTHTTAQAQELGTPHT